MQNISFHYPTWFLFLIIVIAIIYSISLYYKTKTIGSKTKWVHSLLSFLRFSSILTILTLLLGPIFQTIEEESKRPIIAIAIDNSQSIKNWINKSAFNNLSNELKEMSEGLESKFKVDQYYFGDKILLSKDSASYDAPTTNIDQAINYLSDIYEGENLAGVIIATDGIYNDGRNPIYANFRHVCPLYSIALGDTTQLKDIVVKNVLYNEIGYLNDRVQIQIDIQANQSQNNRSTLILEKKQGDNFTEVHKQAITIRKESYFSTVPLTIDLNNVGVNEYRVRVTGLNNESNYQNNSKTFYIDVLDARQNILIIANAPHPDIAALKQVLSKNKNYELDITYDAPAQDVLSRTDLIIFHNLPSKRLDLKTTIDRINARKLPRIYFTGSQTDLNGISTLDQNISIKGSSGSMNDAEGSFNEEFTNYTVSEELKSALVKYPPISSPFGEYSFERPVTTLLYQNIGSIKTDFPLLSFIDHDNIKTAYFFGEGIWKWKFANHLENSNFDLISELLDKAITYTSTKEDKRKFRANTSSKVYTENDNILFSAELYNNTYELINDPEVSLTISNSAGQDFLYTFSPDGNSYILDAGRLEADSYSYEANTSFNGENLESSGRFTIGKLEFELANLEANHNILQSISKKYNGSVFYPNEIEDLKETILNDDSLKPMIFQNRINKSVLDFKWIFIWLAFLLSAEWFIRRYYGTV